MEPRTWSTTPGLCPSSMAVRNLRQLFSVCRHTAVNSPRSTPRMSLDVSGAAMLARAPPP